MNNYDNIKPYADFSHEAAQHGGVDSYLDELAESNRQKGIMEEQALEPQKFGIVAIGAIFAWEVGKFVVNKVKNHIKSARYQKEEMLTQKAESAKTAIQQGVKAAEEAQSTNNDEEDVL